MKELSDYEIGFKSGSEVERMYQKSNKITLILQSFFVGLTTGIILSTFVI